MVYSYTSKWLEEFFFVQKATIYFKVSRNISSCKDSSSGREENGKDREEVLLETIENAVFGEPISLHYLIWNIE